MKVEHIWSEVAEDGTDVEVQIRPRNESPEGYVDGLELTLTKSQAFFLVTTLINTLEQL